MSTRSLPTAHALPRPHAGLACGVAVALVSMLSMGLASCAKHEPEALSVVASFEAPAAELKGMTELATRRTTSFPSPWFVGPVDVKPEGGLHMVRWTLDGEVAAEGPVEIHMLTEMGPEGRFDRMLDCKVQAHSAVAGHARYSCSSAAFHTEVDKQLFFLPAIHTLVGFTPTRLQMEVVTVRVEITARDWWIALPLFAVASLLFWWRPFKRDA